MDGLFYIVKVVAVIAIKNVKGTKEGWNSTEYGCKIILTFGHECSECGYHDSNHRFKNCYTIKETVRKTRQIVKYKIDENVQQTEEQKKKIREEINKKIEEGNKELLERNKIIHDSLREGIDCLFHLDLKNNELNMLALKKIKKNMDILKKYWI